MTSRRPSPKPTMSGDTSSPPTCLAQVLAIAPSVVLATLAVRDVLANTDAPVGDG